MKTISMFIFALIVIFCLWKGLTEEKVQVYKLSNDAPIDSMFGAYEIVDQSTYDGWINYKSKPYDRNSLVPESLSNKDCAT